MYPVDPANGYQVRARDLEFLGYSREQLEWWHGRTAPNGLTPLQFREFRSSLLDALRTDGVPVESVEVYLKGSSVSFFANKRKALPTPAELADQPVARARLEQWLGDDADRPRSRLFDAMHRLGLEPPSDVDLVISSDEMVRRARERYEADPAHGPDDYLHPKYRFVHKSLMNEAFPSMADWTDRWQAMLGREVTPAVFGLRDEQLEPPDIDQAVRWKIVGPEALNTVGSGPMREAGYEDRLRITPPELPVPGENPRLRGNQQRGIDRALLRFLDSEVSLSADAYRVLGERVADVHRAFVEDSRFGENENRLLGQGSCFYGTAIQPVAERGLDVDVLLELPYRADWNPQRYLVEAERALNESRTCAGSAQRQSRNVRIDFPGEVHVDVVPMVQLPSGERAIVNFDEDAFQPVDPVGIAEWIDQQDSRAGGSLRPAVRLLKYANAVDGELPLAPIALTIQLGEQIKRSGLAQAGLTEDLRQLTEGLCEATADPSRKPRIDDPSRPDVNFDHRWKPADYQRFRVGIREYNERLANALRTDPEGTRADVWVPVFGKDFAKYLNKPAVDSELQLSAARAFGGSAPAARAVDPGAQPARWRSAGAPGAGERGRE
ncbi:hypothetical protein GCM10009554_62250 [Kribbella koreensis]|uniref:Nucleotidyltransferase AbiEii toxin of type IV toxin-antitoxin system n=1 Tax=Kribbella koreensis TaxID=57909 RepID=A0ABP4BX15_9ACTN